MAVVQNKLDGEWMYDLTSCGNSIKSWKTSYMRKNSKHPATINARCNHIPNEPFAWKYFIECWVNGKLVSQLRIMKEAYDVLVRDMPTEQYTGIAITTLISFTPQQ